MYGLEEKCYCPICGAEYVTNPKICRCGFEGLTFTPFYIGEELKDKFKKAEDDLLFKIFKYAKQVYYGEKEYKRSELVFYGRDDHVDVDEALERRGLAYIDAPTVKGLPTVASEGLLAMRSNIRAVILNVSEICETFLDECSAEILLLGADVKRFSNGGFKQFKALRYIWVDGKNKYFTAEDNILFNAGKTKIIAYARSRPNEEYTVPKCVKSLEPYSFNFPLHLKRLYLPRRIRISDNAFVPNNVYNYVSGELVKVTPSVEIIYYD